MTFYFARRVRWIGLSDSSSVSLIKLARRQDGSELIYLFTYYFLSERTRPAETKILIHLPEEEREVMVSSPFGRYSLVRPRRDFIPIMGTLSWLHRVACGPASNPPWVRVDSPLAFKRPLPQEMPQELQAIMERSLV